jgi:hypothetical protein
MLRWCVANLQDENQRLEEEVARLRSQPKSGPPQHQPGPPQHQPGPPQHQPGLPQHPWPWQSLDGARQERPETKTDRYEMYYAPVSLASTGMGPG